MNAFKILRIIEGGTLDCQIRKNEGLHFYSEHERLVQRYEEWQKLREVALDKAGPSTADAIKKLAFPEPPPPLDESEIADVTLDMSQAAIEAEVTQQELDVGGIERVPDADPGLDHSYELNNSQPAPSSPTGGGHLRRKSVLPVDDGVLRDLQAHRSLEDSGFSRPFGGRD